MVNNKKVYIFISIIFLIIAGFLLRREADKNVREGTKLLINERNPLLARQKFHIAEIQWPFLYFDKSFHTSKKDVEVELKRPVNIIYLKDNAKKEEIDSLIDSIKAFPRIREVKFISKEEADRRYLESVSGSLRDLYRLGIIPAYIEIYADDFTIRGKFSVFKDNPIVESIL